MPKNRDGVVVASRRYGFAIGSRPFLAIGLRDFTKFSFVQTRPTLLQRSQTFPPVISRARFNARVIVEIAKMNYSGFAEGHFRRDFAFAVANPMAMLFQKLSELGLC